MHDQYIRNIIRQIITEEDTFLWLLRGYLKGETKGEITAVHDRALRTKYHATKILQKETDGKCRICKQFDETVEHIISACPILAKEQYIKRYDTVSAQLHFNVCKEIRAKLDNKQQCNHVPKSVKTSHEGKVNLLWNQQVQTDRTIPNNKPDIITSDNKQGTCMLIDVAIPGDRNVIKKEAEKILKYRDIIIEIQCMWNVKAKVMPVITGVTETISKSLRQYLSNIPVYPAKSQREHELHLGNISCGGHKEH